MAKQVGRGGNRVEEPAPVPDGGDANVFQIVGSRLGQDLGVSLILPEHLLVSLSRRRRQPSMAPAATTNID